jgi:predicted site-specific integrase-resolvase
VDYVSAKVTAEKWGVHVRVVQELCKDGRVKGAARLSREWMIPKDAEKPASNRKNSGRKKKKQGSDSG